MRAQLQIGRTTTLLVLACGCGGPPLHEGTYDVELEEITSETCGLSDEDYGVGEAELINIEWDGEQLIFSGSGDAQGVYVWDGANGFSAESDEVAEVEGTNCAVRAERELQGTILSEFSFTIESDAYFSTEGDCSNVDTTGMPCSAVGLFRGELVE